MENRGWKTPGSLLRIKVSRNHHAGYLKRLEAAKKKKTSTEKNKQKTSSASQESGTAKKRKLNPTPRKSSSTLDKQGD